MPTKQGTDFVSLLYASYISTIHSFLGRAEGSFKDGRSRVKYFAISNKIYDMKTTLILNREYKKLPSAKNILGHFCYVQFSEFCYCTFGCTSKSQNRKWHRIQRRVYSRNSDASVKWWQDTGFCFCFCQFSFSFKCYKVWQEMCEFNTKITIVQLFEVDHCLCTVKNLLSKTRLFITR